MAKLRFPQFAQAQKHRWIENHRWLRLALLAAAAAFSVLFALRFAGHVDHFILIWPASGVFIAFSLRYWRPEPLEQAWSILAGAVGVFVGGLAVGMPGYLALQIVLLTAIDAWIAGWLLGGRVSRFDDLKRTENVMRLGLATLIGPILTGVLGAIPLSHFLHAPFLFTAAMNSLANSLGIALLVPLLLFFLSGDLSRLKRLASSGPAGAGWFLCFLAIAVFVFWQNTRPFLFIIFPPLIGIIVTLGLEGGILASAALVEIGWVATLYHHGPLWLNTLATPDQRLMTLQMFIWVFLATALITGVLVEDRTRAREELEEASTIYHILVDNAADMIVLSSLDGARRYVSPSVETITGWTPAEYLALERLLTVHPEDLDIATSLLSNLSHGQKERTIRYRLMRKDGGFRWVEAVVKGYGNPEGNALAGYVATVRDISHLKLIEEEWQNGHSELTRENARIVALANTDGLTGLINKRAFDAGMLHLQHRRKTDWTALLMIDVDHFKLYNDTFGHLTGDDCLKCLASAFSRRVTRDGDLVARWGGEEFAILLTNTDEHGATAVAKDLLRLIAELRIIHPKSPFAVVTLSIGIALARPNQSIAPADLVAQADLALYESKRAGRNRLSLWQDLSLEEASQATSPPGQQPKAPTLETPVYR